MSTEHQKYSTQNQSEANHRYAERRGFEIVRTYSDAGRSGLKLERREGLQQLIDHVVGGTADFEVILVYDVSRWGRFQDVDESAFLEHICTRAGIIVHYCAEQFENDGSLSATIIKNIKRAMAGEYSRELSTKVFAGQCRLVSLGFFQGGSAGLGLRRQLVDENGHPKGVLEPGQRKSIHSDRIVLVPGPTKEIRTVRRIFELFVKDRLNETQIAALLNDRDVPCPTGRPWRKWTINKILTDERYIGNNVRNRTSYKLQKKRVRNPPELIVRAEGVFTPILDRALFEAASKRMVERLRRFTNAQLLDGLTALLEKAGRLNHKIIDTDEDLPWTRTYHKRFGGLMPAYELIGYSPTMDLKSVETRQWLRPYREEIVTRIIASLERQGATVARDPATKFLRINEQFTACISMACCREKPNAAPRWKVRFGDQARPDFVICVRLASGNREVLDYYVIPRIDFAVVEEPIRERNGLEIDAYRFESLGPFIEMMAHSQVAGRPR